MNIFSSYNPIIFSGYKNLMCSLDKAFSYLRSNNKSYIHDMSYYLNLFQTHIVLHNKK